MYSLSPPPPALGYILPVVSFFNDGFDIRKNTKNDMPLKKETDLNLIFKQLYGFKYFYLILIIICV